MLLPVAVIAVGALLGFVGSRKLRRPQTVAQAASVARTVSGSVGRRKTLTAPELQRACFSEMVRHVRVNRQGRTEAPARYLIQLSADDLEVVDETRGWFVDGLTDALRTAAQDNGWELDGTIDIRFEADPSRRPGVPNALAVDPEGPKKAKPTTPPPAGAPKAPTGGRSTRLAVVRTDTSERIVLGSDVITIGRSTDSTIVVDDTRVSRAHATIGRGRSAWTITDSGSSNGTTLNGRLLTPNSAQTLAAGDVIGVGPVDLRVEAEGAPSRPAGTRALDDSDRTRISGEVLPPPRRPRP
ncbi:FhaA domain-containing protein [Aquihabitans sp. McL0605]|uniref:FhaA domain-containing protein n=1 Tax=Aquihabitans sp. McL0605 TaxID=3415671 RepID=UPI003CF1897E